ncbi:MAG: cytochrome-c peroxidase [Flavobacteriales bacterium]
MKRIAFVISLLTALIVLFDACQKDEVLMQARVPFLPSFVYAYDTPVKESFFNPYGDSTINNDVATLGRVLFYETQLSHNNRVSCGSCHIQNHGFADNNTGSFGFGFGVTGRNTQSIVNTGTQVGFFWDLREAFLDHMVLQPIANHLEMGIADTLYMEEKVRQTDYYRPLFIKAFGSDEITSKKIGRALAQFVKSLISVSTKYDEGYMIVDPNENGNVNHFDFPNFTEQENFGKQLFFLKFPCSTCHGGVNLDGSLTFPQNVGLEVDYKDNGMAGIEPDSGQPRDGWFKTPSLRNVTLTGPYMHDGRFKTLEEVVEFYNSGIQPHPQLSQTLRKHSDGGLFDFGPDIPEEAEPPGRRPLRMFMTSDEKAALVAFMRTLTDYSLISDVRFSDPFITP